MKNDEIILSEIKSLKRSLAELRNPKEYITPEECARRWGYSRSWLKNMRLSGKLQDYEYNESENGNNSFYTYSVKEIESLRKKSA